MSEKKIKIANNTTQFINQAWVRNGDNVLTGESLIVATLLHSTGGGRDSEDMKVVQSLMKDINLNDKE